MARARLCFKLGYLHKLPYMLCRARDRGVAQLCMQEFAKKLYNQHVKSKLIN